MTDPKIMEELRELLLPFVGEKGPKKDWVTKEDVEDVLSDIQDYHVEQKMLEAVKAHPEGPFWDFLKLIPYRGLYETYDDEEEDE